MGTLYQADDQPPVIPYRLSLLERWRDGMVEWRQDVDKDRGDLERLVADVRSLKRIGVGLLVSFVTGSASITIAIVLATWGK